MYGIHLTSVVIARNEAISGRRGIQSQTVIPSTTGIQFYYFLIFEFAWDLVFGTWNLISVKCVQPTRNNPEIVRKIPIVRNSYGFLPRFLLEIDISVGPAAIRSGMTSPEYFIPAVLE
jgi:hypothetical protein